MKLTPLLLFLLLLFVLVSSVVLNKWLPLNMTEGFSSFYQDSRSGNSIIIPQYSKTVNVYKVYDNLFFDPNNGNFIIINGETYTTTVDISGITILNVGVIQRISTNLLTYTTETDSFNRIIPSVDSKIITTTVTSSYTSWHFEASPYQVFYMPWNDSTFIQIMDISSHKPICVSLFGSGGVNSNYTYLPADIPTMPTEYGGVDTTPINQFISEPFYNANQKIYAISDYVRFDTKNGDLILQTGSSSGRTIKVYKGTDIANRTASTVTSSSYTKDTAPAYTTTGDVYDNKYDPFLTSRQFKPFMVVDTYGKNLVLYTTMGQKTLIALISVDSNNSSIYRLRHVVRFNPAVSGGVETANIADTTDKTTDDKKTDDKKTDDDDDKSDAGSCDDDLDKHDRAKAPSLDSIISDYYKQYWYSSTNASNINQYSDDFMLKTQMIPPICPACPACPSTTTCTNCGGNGGSGLYDHDHKWTSANGTTWDGKYPDNWKSSGPVGTRSYSTTTTTSGGTGATGTSNTTTTNWSDQTYDQYHDQGHRNGLGNAIGGIADGLGDVAGGALQGAGGLAGGALQGAGGIVGGALHGAGGIVGGAGNVVGGALQGAGNVVGGVAGGIGSAIGGLGQPTNVQNIGLGQGYGQSSDQTRAGYYNSQSSNMTGGNYKGFIDPYSYNGALSSKGGDPLPMTSDFSNFGR